MSDSVIITLIVVGAVVLIAFKDKITSLFFKASKLGVEGGMTADKSKGIIGNLFLGIRNKLRVTDKTNAQDNKFVGKENEVEVIVQPSSPAKKAAKK
ncbi:MAG: hypothetical protein PHP00_00455 [Thiotrichaceae bacterium]|nr:hypothetical protein [Thiotrichaceae bacterium]